VLEAAVAAQDRGRLFRAVRQDHPRAGKAQAVKPLHQQRDPGVLNVEEVEIAAGAPPERDAVTGQEGANL